MLLNSREQSMFDRLRAQNYHYASTMLCIQHARRFPWVVFLGRLIKPFRQAVVEVLSDHSSLQMHGCPRPFFLFLVSNIQTPASCVTSSSLET